MRNILGQVLAGVFLLGSSLATTIVEPHFGHPHVFDDRIVFTSVDGTQLIGIDKSGKLRWTLKYAQRIYEQRAGTSMLVQAGRQVFKVDVEDGTQAAAFVMPEHELFVAGFSDAFVAYADERYDHPKLKVLDPISHEVSWESSTIESIEHVTPSTLIAVTGKRIFVKGGYRLEDTWLSGLDRKNGRTRWSFPIDSLVARTTPAGKYLALAYRLSTYHGAASERFLVVDAETGEVVHSQDGTFANFWAMDESLAVIELVRGDPGEAQFYRCTLPECREVAGSRFSLSAKEILTFRVHGDYVITAGIYDSACFSLSRHTRLWQKGQLEWSIPFGNQMVITDFSRQDQTARILSISLETGEERTLFSMPVTAHDREAFRPW